MPMRDLDSIQHHKLTLGELAAEAFPDGNYDTAKPQGWLNALAAEASWLTYHELNATLVWYYPKRTESQYWLSGLPGVLCEETARELDRQNIPYWTYRGYHGQRLLAHEGETK